jgi:uncharacterized membrane protein
MSAVQILYMDQGLKMDNGMATGFAGMIMFMTVIGFLLAVLWFFLPFAVFGTKPKIDAAIAEARRANEQLQAIAQEQAATRQAIEELNATLLRGLRSQVASPAVPPPPVPRA